MSQLFKKTKVLIIKIENFIDLIEQSSLHFNTAIKLYLKNDKKLFEKRLKIISETEKHVDIIRKDIESQLYRQTLIPESRGDVLGLLESMDSIADSIKTTIVAFSIENPVIPEEIKNDLLELVIPVGKTIESLVRAARAYFNDVNSVKNHLNKIKFYEKEADNLAEQIKRDIFKMDIDLSHQMQLRYFTHQIDTVADIAEDVSNRLAIASIKRLI